MPASTVKIKLVGASDAIRQLQGVRRGLGDSAAAERKAAEQREKLAKKASEAQQKAAQKAALAAEKAAKRSETAQTRAAERSAREAQRSAEKQRREADRLSAHWRRLAQRSADQRIREEQRVTRAAAREAAKQARAAEQTARRREAAARKTLRRAGGVVGGVTAGVLAGGVSAVDTARNVAGVDDIATRVRKANDFRESAVVLGGNVNMSSSEIGAMQTAVLDAAMKNAKDPTEIMEGLAIGHERFNLLGPLVENIDEISRAAKASMGTVPEFVGMLGSLTTAFGLTSDQMGEALNIVVGAAREGAIDPADFASSFAASAGIFATNTNQRGIEGLRQFVGTAQAVGAGQFGGSESATRVERLVTDLMDADTLKALKGIRVDAVGADGKIDMGSLLDQLAGNTKFQTSTQRQKIFKEVRALQAINQLLAQREKVERGEAGAVDFRSMSSLSESVGEQGTARIMQMLEQGGTLEVQRQAIDMQKEAIEHLDDFNEQILAVNESANKLEKSFGTLSLWARSIGVGAAGAGAGVLLSRLGGTAGAGAAGATAAAGGTTALAAGGTAIGALGAGTIAAGALAAGAVGAGVGVGINEATAAIRDDGRSFSEMIVDWMTADILEARRGPSPLGPSVSTPVEGEIKVLVDVDDSRTRVRTATTRSRGARISTGAGPALPGAL